MPLKDSQLVEKLARKAFSECDVDRNGNIDAKELHVGLLLVFDKLNQKLPVHVKPPNHDAVRVLMRRHDIDGTGALDFFEFLACVKEMIGLGEPHRFTESLPFQVVLRMALKMAIFPALAFGLKRVLKEAGVESATKVPDGVLVFAMEGAVKALKVAAPNTAEA